MDTLEARGEAGLAKTYLERARELKPMLAAASDEIERGRQVIPEIVEAMKERGIFRMLLPRSLGGAELDPLTYTDVLYTLAQGDGSTAWCLGQNSGCSMIAPYLPEDTAREVFGGRDGILAWGPDVPGAGGGVVTEGGYRLSGQWGFATGSRHASWLGCHVSLFEPDGSPRLLPNGRQQVRTMVFPKSDARIIDNWQVLGLRGTGSDSYAHEDYFVPQRRTAGRDNFDELREKGPLYQFTSGMIYAMSFSAVVDGHRQRRLRRLYRDRPRQGAEGIQGHLAPEQRDPVADRAVRGQAEIGARLFARGHRRDVAGSLRYRQDQRRASPAIAAGRDLGDPPGPRCRGDGLSRRRRDRDFRVRTRSSAACATSTPAPSRARAARCTSRPSARS